MNIYIQLNSFSSDGSSQAIKGIVEIFEVDERQAENIINGLNQNKPWMSGKKIPGAEAGIIAHKLSKLGLKSQLITSARSAQLHEQLTSKNPFPSAISSSSRLPETSGNKNSQSYLFQFHGNGLELFKGLYHLRVSV